MISNGVIREFNDQIATGWEVWQSTILQILNLPDLKWSFQNPLLEESRTAWFRHASWAAFASESSQSRCRCILRAPCIRRCEGPIFATLLSWMVEKPMLKPYWMDNPKSSQEDFLWIYRKAWLEPPASLNMKVKRNPQLKRWCRWPLLVDGEISQWIVA